MDLLQPHIRELASATRNSAQCSTELALQSWRLLELLRMVPTKYKRFCTRLGPCRNRKSLQGLFVRLFVSTKKNWGSNVLFTCKFLNKIIETALLASVSMKAFHWFS